MKLGFFSPEIQGGSVESVFAEAARLGFSQVQYSFETSHGEEMPASFHPGELERVKAAGAEHGITFAAVNGTFNMIDPNRERREEYVRRFSLIASACEALSCPVITLCTGSRHPDSGWLYHPDSALDDAWADLIETTRRLIPVAEAHGVILGVETEASNVVFTVERARRYLDEIGNDRLKVIIDCANLFPAGTARKEAMRPAIQKAFDLLGKDIVLAHGKDICESDGVEFASPGKGIVDYGFFFSLLKAQEYKAGLILHGVHDPADFSFSIARMREELERAGL